MTKKFAIGNFQLAISLNRRSCRGKKRHSLTRFFRMILERKWVKNVFGINLAVAVLFTNVIGQPISASNLEAATEITTISPTNTTITTNRSVRVPTQSLVINQKFTFIHRGIDLEGEIGEPVYPAMEGGVEKTIRSRFSYGNYIIVKHEGDFATLYAHLSQILVKEGDRVDKNTVIGLVGKSGWTTGPHLHFEVWENGRPINPLTILPTKED